MLSTKTILRFLAYNTLGRIHFRTKKENDLLIFTTSRSGSTWFVDNLLNTGLFLLYNQPFDTILNKHTLPNRLPRSSSGYFISLSEAEKKKLLAFFHRMRQGFYAVNVPFRLFGKSFSFFYQRKLFKTFFIKDQYELFNSYNDLDIIYLTRHPVPTALSNIAYGYPTSVLAYTNNELFWKNLTSKQKALIEDIRDNGGKLENYVLGWFLENHTIMSTISQTNNRILHLTYEEMVLSPETSREKIEKHLQFKKGIFCITAKSASKSTHKKALTKIRSGSKETLAYGWKKEITPEQYEQVKKIFSAFPQTTYNL